MGKEIRVAFAVVGVLLVLFCGLLARRLTQTDHGPPDVSIPVEDTPVPLVTLRETSEPRRYPTVIKSDGWDEVSSPARVNPEPERPVPTDDGDVPPRNPAGFENELPSNTNPRWHDRPQQADDGTDRG